MLCVYIKETYNLLSKYLILHLFCTKNKKNEKEKNKSNNSDMTVR